MSANGFATKGLIASLLCVPYGCGVSGSEDAGPAVVTVPPTAGEPVPAPGGGGAVPMPSGGGDLFDPTEIPPPNTGEPVAAPPRRRGLLDQQVSCDGASTTSVSGTVYMPSGELPLYNVMVYVPDAELLPLTPGASCTCEISGEPIVSALTDANGRFVLENVPVGEDIPLVIQVGDWRRELAIPSVAPCVDTPVQDRTLRLPARRSEGDLPLIAVATGARDALECLVQKLGVDASEFTNPADGGRVHLFGGYGGTRRYTPAMNDGQPFSPGEALWYDTESLSQYDIVLLSCEGVRNHVDNKDEQARQAMFEYANLGGRVFASHFQGVWFHQGPAPFPSLAQFTDESESGYEELSAQVVTSFPKGQALADWLLNTEISLDGVVPIEGGAHTIVTENPAYSQRWIDTEDPASVQYISANTPLGAADADQCGRVVLSDIHVSAGGEGDDFSDTTEFFPAGCVTSGLTPQEAVLAFMLFDLSACIVPDDQAPVAPPIIR